MPKMEGMLKFPKEPQKKKRKKHKKSILQDPKSRQCYLCILEGCYREYPTLHTHHIFPGTANRAKSEEHGLTVRLCPRHHEYSEDAVHGNRRNQYLLKAAAQKKFEETHSREEFLREFGKSIL